MVDWPTANSSASRAVLCSQAASSCTRCASCRALSLAWIRGRGFGLIFVPRALTVGNRNCSQDVVYRLGAPAFPLLFRSGLRGRDG